jgi:hypothetical protein
MRATQLYSMECGGSTPLLTARLDAPPTTAVR